jgi:3-oxoacyl-[acyl-carrier protein] reductase
MIGCRGGGVLVTFLRLQPSKTAVGQSAAYVADRSSDATAVVGAIRAAGGRAEAVEADLADPESAENLFDAAEAALGPVSILVNNASAWRQDTFAPPRHDRYGRPNEVVTAATFGQFLVDARGSALLIAELARRHVARSADWGRIISLTSGSPDGFPAEASYGAAKAALDSYTMTAARELAGFGITANLVHPPITDTGWVTPEVERAALEASPFGVAQPDEVAAAVGLLLTRAADRVTGTTLRVR